MSHYLDQLLQPGEPASAAPAPLPEVTAEDCEAMDDTAAHLRTESGFITFDPVPLNAMQRIERAKQREAMHAGTPAGIDTWFDMLKETV